MKKFKVGDWVRDDIGKVEQLEYQHFSGITKRNKEFFNGLQEWKPEEGEWCFCTWNKENIILMQFNCMDDEHFLCTGLDGINRRYNTCEPFIGALPHIRSC